MKKLIKKVFFTILSIFSFFLIILVLLYNCQLYKTEYETIIKSLDRIKGIILNDESINSSDKNIFIDYRVYTIILDNNNNIKSIINHNYDNIIDNDIKTIAINILNGKQKNENLYSDRYFYILKNGSFLTIIDNQTGQRRLILNLEISLIFLVLFELLTIYISKKITIWITKPAIESFEKQKNFIADASHELKTPIAVIMASTDAYDNNKDEKYLQNIKKETEKMNNLVCDLLELSRVENESNKDLFSKVDLSKLVNKTILTFDSLAYENDLTIDADISDNIIFSCNYDEIENVLEILLDNAIKHSYKKETIKVELKIVKDNIIINVINKGDELKKEDEEKIFERFYRADKSRKRDENRYGLGLAIAKGIVLNHGGKITASSKNSFTTFKIVFPK